MSERGAKAIVTLYTRDGCHLCAEAKDAITRIIGDFGAELLEVDIDSDAGLRARYDNDVPVIFVGDSLFARYRIDPAKFREALAKVTKADAKEAAK
jgi:glutaredoxin